MKCHVLSFSISNILEISGSVISHISSHAGNIENLFHGGRASEAGPAGRWSEVGSEVRGWRRRPDPAHCVSNVATVTWSTWLHAALFRIRVLHTYAANVTCHNWPGGLREAL